MLSSFPSRSDGQNWTPPSLHPPSDPHTVPGPPALPVKNHLDFQDPVPGLKAPHNGSDIFPSVLHSLPVPLSRLPQVLPSHCLSAHKKFSLSHRTQFFYLQDFSGNMPRSLSLPRQFLQPSVNHHAPETAHLSWIPGFHNSKRHRSPYCPVYLLYHCRFLLRSGSLFSLLPVRCQPLLHRLQKCCRRKSHQLLPAPSGFLPDHFQLVLVHHFRHQESLHLRKRSLPCCHVPAMRKSLSFSVYPDLFPA